MFEQRLSNRTDVPAGGFTHKHSISGYEMSFHVWHLLRSAVTKHCEANGYPFVTDEEIEAQICERLGPNGAKRWCVGDGVSVQGVNIGWRDVLHGTMVLGSFLIAGRPLVSEEEAERRAAICAPCSRNVTYAKPCGGDCPELESAVKAIVGNASTTQDVKLGACSTCKCSLKSAVWLPIEIQAKGVTEEMMSQFPSPCWKAAGIRELRTV